MIIKRPVEGDIVLGTCGFQQFNGLLVLLESKCSFRVKGLKSVLEISPFIQHYCLFFQYSCMRMYMIFLSAGSAKVYFIPILAVFIETNVLSFLFKACTAIREALYLLLCKNCSIHFYFII